MRCTSMSIKYQYRWEILRAKSRKAIAIRLKTKINKEHGMYFIMSTLKKFRSRIQHHHATGLSQHLCVNPITIFDIILSLPDGWKTAGPWGNPCEAAVIYLFPTGSRTITPEKVRSLVLSMVSWPRLHSAGFCVIYDISNGLLNTFNQEIVKNKTNHLISVRK